MAQHQEDMTLVADSSELVPKGWYHVRVAKVEEGLSKQEQPVVNLQLKVQNEGPAMGRIIFDNPSLQAHALFKLKAYYNAAGYKPAAGQGHDPDNLLDAEFWVGVDHQIYEGTPRTNIAPYAIRTLQEGPGKPIADKAPKA